LSSLIYGVKLYMQALLSAWARHALHR
jgi:hypothetical protein